MRWPKIATMWQMPHGLQQLLQFFSSIVHVFKELGLGRGLWVGLVVGILIAISITSGMCAVMIMTGKPWTAWTTMVKVLSVEWLILVINVVMLWLFSGAPWKPY